MVDLKKYGFKEEEKMEMAINVFRPTGYPRPVNAYRFLYEIYNQSIEEMYFWMLHHLQQDAGYVETHKITDVFAAAEGSAFWGVSAQRLGIQQDRVQQFLATLGKLMKDLFQLVRELRILDERLELYVTSNKGDHASEIALKGYWVDLVEGGGKNPASVYGMAAQLGFAVLPDLFFAARPPMDPDDVDKYVEQLEFNDKIKEVLKRKLKTFLIWKKHTFFELDNRRRFTLKFLRQHYDVMKMYIDWVKPYLKTVRRLTPDEFKMESADIVGAFENAMIEIEVVFVKPSEKSKYKPVIIGNWMHRSAPQMNYMVEYQKGPIHVGKTVMTLRSYAWTQDEIDNYLKMRREEGFELLSSVDESLKAAMDAMGGDLEKYLEEAGEEMKKEKKKEEGKKVQGESFISPFVSVVGGFGELFGAFGGGIKKKADIPCPKCDTVNKKGVSFCSKCGEMLRKPTRQEIFEWENDKKKAMKDIKSRLYFVYKNYKKAHGFLSW